jgi:ATP-dependent helicase/nuclease subunit B
MTLSPSQVERFFSCRFSYFCQYGLRVRPRRPAELGSLEFGNLAHYVMQEVLPLYTAEGFQKITRARVTADTSAATEAYIEEFMGGKEDKDARFLALSVRLQRTVCALLWQVVQELRQSRFVPVDYELPVGSDGVPATELTLPDGTTVRVVGKIDRVDLLDAEGTRYVKIIDYKSGNKTFSFQDIYYGLQLQLLVYLDAYLKYYQKTGAALKPGGVFYFRITEPTLSLDSEVSAEQIEQTLYEKMKMSGLLLQEDTLIESIDHSLKKDGAKDFSGSSAIVPAGFTKKGNFSSTSNVASEEQYEAILQFVTGRTKEIGQAMKAGIITPLPFRDKDRSPCSYCSYRSICRHDYEDKPKFRKLKKISKADFWTEIMSDET